MTQSMYCWDSLAYNEDALPCVASITGERKSTFSLFRNQAIVREHNPPGVASLILYAGEAYTSEFAILANRAESQRAIFAFCKRALSSSFIACIGCYGVRDDGHYTGISKQTYEEFIDWLFHLQMEFRTPGSLFPDLSGWFKNILRAEPLRYNQGDKFTDPTLSTKFFLTPMDKAVSAIEAY